MQDYERAEFDRVVKSFVTYLGAVVGAVTFGTLFAVDVPQQALYVGTAALAAVTAVGWVAGRVLANVLDCDGRFAQTLCFSQLVTWLFAVLGCCLAMVTWELAEGSTYHAWRMRVLSTIGSIASVTNGAVELYLATT